MPVFVYITIGAILFGLFLIVSISQVKKFGKFLMVWDNPDFKSPPAKHSRKVMIYAILKYWGFLFILAFCSTVSVIVTIVTIPIWTFWGYLTFHYIRVWKYHKYSVFLFIAAALAVIAGSIVLSPVIKDFFRVNFLW